MVSEIWQYDTQCIHTAVVLLFNWGRNWAVIFDPGNKMPFGYPGTQVTSENTTVKQT